MHGPSPPPIRDRPLRHFSLGLNETVQIDDASLDYAATRRVGRLRAIWKSLLAFALSRAIEAERCNTPNA